MQGNHLQDEIDRILARIDGELNDQEPETNTEQPPEETEGISQALDGVQDIYVLVVRERDTAPGDAQVIDSVPPETGNDNRPEYVAPFLLSFGILLSLSCILLQMYLAFYPPTAIVTIIPKSQLVITNGTLQLGWLLSPITLSQSQTIPMEYK